MSNRPTSDNPWKALFLMTAIGVDFAVCVFLGYLAGNWLSNLMGGHPIWLVVGLFAGILAGGGSVYVLIRPFLYGGKK